MAAAAVLWDLDGTLVDSREDIAAAGNVARAALGLPALPVPEIAAMVGDGLGALLRRLCGDDPMALGLAEAEFVAHYAEHCADATAVYPGVVEVVAAIAAAGIPQGVVTNKPLAFSQRILEATGLAPTFATVQGGDAARKPAPDQLHIACAELSVPPAASWMVGDHHTDLLAGRAAGCRTAHCAWGIGHSDGVEHDLRLEAPGDLLAALGVGEP